jgi:hypothetical protein|tara:strand:- start:1491 stop:1988 length:498 start_codon:yes stop_codon:yes gene_type:complete
MATDAKTGQPIFGGHNSWGRTHSPKNLTGTQGGKVTLSSAGNLLGITATTTGYATENQRYLHVLTEDNHDDGAPGTIKVYGYCHAFLRWFEIEAQTMGLKVAEAAANTAPTAAIIVAPANSGHADAALLTPDEREYRTYEILGIDRVAFVTSADGTDCYAACSTF